MQIKEINVSRSVCFNIGQQYSNEVLVIHFKGLPDLPNKYIYVKKDNYEKEVPLVGDLYVVSRPLTTYSGEVKAQIIARDPRSAPIALTPNFKMMIIPSDYGGIGEDENYPDDPNIKNYYVKIDGKIQSMDELIALVQSKLDNGEFIGAQGPRGEKGDPGDVTEEYRNLASQIAQNASDAQASATNAQVSATNAQKALDDTKTFANQAISEVNQIKTDTNTLKDELADKKITKFYASNQGETHVSDSDKGLIQDLKIYGKSSQDGTPSPDNPVEIKSVVNPTIKVIGKNLIKFDESFNSDNFGITMIYEKGGIRMTGTATGDGNIRIIDPNKEIIKWNKYTVSLKATDVCPASLYVADAKNEAWESVAGVNINETRTFEKTIDVVGVFITFVKGETYDVLLYPQVEYGTQASEYEPYKEQSIALPITLNAIPVSSSGNVTIDGQQYIADYVDVERGKIVRKVDSSRLDNTQSIIDKTEWLLAEQQETALTTEQVQALKELATYYHVTNISVNSEQLDGYTVFNYPISLANGWNYVKQQLNDNRDYIYDMDLQSAEAYVNSEYAVTLTELEV